MGVGLRFGSKIVMSISRYGRKITRLTYLSVEKKKATHQVIVGVIVFLMLIRKEPITCAD